MFVYVYVYIYIFVLYTYVVIYVYIYMYSIPGTQNRSSDLNVYPPFWGSLQLGHDQRYSLSIGLPKFGGVLEKKRTP